MCNDPECRWITIIEDDKTGEKCYTHYKFNADMSFEEILVEGDRGLKIYAEVLRDHKYRPSQPSQVANIVMDFAGNLIVLDGNGEMITPDMYEEDELPPKLTILGEDETKSEDINLESIIEDLDTIPTLPNVPHIIK